MNLSRRSRNSSKMFWPEILQICLFANLANSANILGITTVISHSHHIWNEVLAEGLLAKGHNVTLLSHDPARIQHPNYTVIQIEGIYEALATSTTPESSPTSGDFSPFSYWTLIETTCLLDLAAPALSRLLAYPASYKFDLILFDVNAGQCLYPLIRRFGHPPVVGVSPFGVQSHVSAIFGDHIQSYIPFHSFKGTDRMGAVARAANLAAVLYMNWLRGRAMEVMRAAAEERFGEVEDFWAVERRFAVGLVNSDAVFNFPQALAPNVVAVGGLHVKEAKAVGKEIQEVMDRSRHGVIYFALGSNLQSEKMSQAVLDSFSQCFATLPQTILWKIDAKNLQLPKNVKAGTWFAQNDILANPKTILFISHGGGLSTQEAMYHGVPIVGVPFFLDQISNVERLVDKGVAEKIDLAKINKDYVCAKIRKVLQEPKYGKNMKILSSRFKDKEIHPLEKAVFWVEYVLRHKGSEHLSLAIRDMSNFQAYNLDLLLIALGLLTAIVSICTISIKLLLRISTKKVKIH